MFIATLIAADRLHAGDISAAMDRLREAKCAPIASADIETGVAADLLFDHAPDTARAALEGQFEGVDVVVQPSAGREKALLVADMDSTMITVECIDELADYAGVKDQVAAITKRAMRGELDFEAALDARVALLKGLDRDLLTRCHDERVRITPGATLLVRTMRARGAHALLVSGGFTQFAERVAVDIGFERAHANRLDVDGARLSGTVAKPVLGADSKRATLLAALDEFKLGPDRCLAIGDGANDIPMLQAAGLGVAYHAKPAAIAAADATIMCGDLSALLYAQGIARSEWITE